MCAVCVGVEECCCIGLVRCDVFICELCVHVCFAYAVHVCMYVRTCLMYVPCALTLRDNVKLEYKWHIPLADLMFVPPPDAGPEGKRRQAVA